ncbi:MAG: hypothetical protein AAF388_02535 [Bacteroidota bacterium]
MKKRKTDYNLKERLKELPESVVMAIRNKLRDDFEMYPNRWSSIVNDRLSGLYDYEVAVFCYFARCSVFDLMDKDVDLGQVYRESLGSRPKARKNPPSLSKQQLLFESRTGLTQLNGSS